MKNKIAKIFFLISAIFFTLHNSQAAGLTQYKVTSESGSLGCNKKEDFDAIIKAATSQDVETVKDMMMSEDCVFIEQGAMIFGTANICRGLKDADLAAFQLTKTSAHLFVPCVAIKVVPPTAAKPIAGSGL